MSIIHRLWQGTFEHSGGFFTSTFWECVESDQIEMMEYIGEKPSGMDKFDQLKWSCLHTVAYCIHPELMIKDAESKHLATDTLKKLFVKHFKDLMNFSIGGNLPIHLACQMNNSYILKIVIEVANEKLSQEQFNEMLNQVKKDKYWNYTPLMIAIKNNSIDCVKELCKYDCVIDGILNYKSRYPHYNSFEFACYYNNIDILKIFCNVCDLNKSKLNSKDYLLYLKKLANYGLSKLTHAAGCIEFLDELSSSSIAKPKQVIFGANTTDVISNRDKHQVKFLCLNKHTLPRETLCMGQQCDICQASDTKCVACTSCASHKDSNLFPTVICEQCAMATSVWSTIVNPTQNASQNDYLERTLPNLINADTIDRVESWLLIYV